MFVSCFVPKESCKLYLYVGFNVPLVCHNTEMSKYVAVSFMNLSNIAFM